VLLNILSKRKYWILY